MSMSRLSEDIQMIGMRVPDPCIAQCCFTLGVAKADIMGSLSADMSLGSYAENKKRKKRKSAWRISRQKPIAFPITV